MAPLDMAIGQLNGIHNLLGQSGSPWYKGRGLAQHRHIQNACLTIDQNPGWYLVVADGNPLLIPGRPGAVVIKVLLLKNTVHRVGTSLQERRAPTFENYTFSQYQIFPQMKLGTFDFTRIEGSKLAGDSPLSNGLGLELLLRHPLPVLEVVPVCHRVARNLVPVVPPLVHKRVVRVRMGYEMCRPEQRCHKNSKLFLYLRAHPLGLLYVWLVGVPKSSS